MSQKEREEIERDLQLLRRITNKVFDIDHRVFLEVERVLEEVIKWALISKEKRKPAVNNWTASPQRQIGYLIESLEYKIKKLEDSE